MPTPLSTGGLAIHLKHWLHCEPHCARAAMAATLRNGLHHQPHCAGAALPTTLPGGCSASHIMHWLPRHPHQALTALRATLRKGGNGIHNAQGLHHQPHCTRAALPTTLPEGGSASHIKHWWPRHPHQALAALRATLRKGGNGSHTAQWAASPAALHRGCLANRSARGRQCQPHHAPVASPPTSSTDFLVIKHWWPRHPPHALTALRATLRKGGKGIHNAQGLHHQPHCTRAALPTTLPEGGSASHIKHWWPRHPHQALAALRATLRKGGNGSHTAQWAASPAALHRGCLANRSARGRQCHPHHAPVASPPTSSTGFLVTHIRHSCPASTHLGTAAILFRCVVPGTSALRWGDRGLRTAASTTPSRDLHAGAALRMSRTETRSHVSALQKRTQTLLTSTRTHVGHAPACARLCHRRTLYIQAYLGPEALRYQPNAQRNCATGAASRTAACTATPELSCARLAHT